MVRFAKLSPVFIRLPLASVFGYLFGVGGPELVCIKNRNETFPQEPVLVGRKITIQYFRHLSEANELLAQHTEFILMFLDGKQIKEQMAWMLLPQNQ